MNQSKRAIFEAAAKDLEERDSSPYHGLRGDVSDEVLASLRGEA